MFEKEGKDLVDILLDEDNHDTIILEVGNGRSVEFEQVAVIPYGEFDDDLYCILKPITPMEGVKDDEAIVFKVMLNENREFVPVVEKDRKIAIEVFNIYYDMLEQRLKDDED